MRKYLFFKPTLLFPFILIMISLISITDTPASETVPIDQDVCFTPDEPCDQKLIELIKSAKTSIDVAIYDLNLDELVHQLLIQSKRIKVRVVVDQRQSKGKHSLVPTLAKAGVDLRYGRQRGIMHNKFMIIDGKMIETGSFNFTHHASRANQENQIYLSSPIVVKRYRDRFEKIWSTAMPFEK
jgi:phosphatidylserine/phosphatidylglycerophosphate/cardiolipin synthase-like enzyme